MVELAEKCGDHSVKCISCEFMGTVRDLLTVYPNIGGVPMEGSPIPAGECPVCTTPVIHTSEADYQEFLAAYLNREVGDANELLDRHPWVM